MSWVPPCERTARSIWESSKINCCSSFCLSQTKFYFVIREAPSPSDRPLTKTTKKQKYSPLVANSSKKNILLLNNVIRQVQSNWDLFQFPQSDYRIVQKHTYDNESCMQTTIKAEKKEIGHHFPFSLLLQLHTGGDISSNLLFTQSSNPTLTNRVTMIQTTFAFPTAPRPPPLICTYVSTRNHT